MRQKKNPVYLQRPRKLKCLRSLHKKKYLYIHASSDLQVGTWMPSTRVPQDFMCPWTFYESTRDEVLPRFVTTKSTVICNVTLCSFVHIPVFWRIMQPPYPIQKIRPWRWRQQFLPKHLQSSFYRLYDETEGLQSQQQFYWTLYVPNSHTNTKAYLSFDRSLSLSFSRSQLKKNITQNKNILFILVNLLHGYNTIIDLQST